MDWWQFGSHLRDLLRHKIPEKKELWIIINQTYIVEVESTMRLNCWIVRVHHDISIFTVPGKSICRILMEAVCCLQLGTACYLAGHVVRQPPPCSPHLRWHHFQLKEDQPQSMPGSCTPSRHSYQGTGYPPWSPHTPTTCCFLWTFLFKFTLNTHLMWFYMNKNAMDRNKRTFIAN
jgi:hypothetical protein